MIDWISVKERLPEKSDRYLICANKYMAVSDFSVRHKKFNAFDFFDDTDKAFTDVTHWAYLNLPEGE